MTQIASEAFIEKPRKLSQTQYADFEAQFLSIRQPQ